MSRYRSTASRARKERKAGSLAVIRVGDLDVANPIVAVTRRDGYLSPAAKKLLAILRAELG